MSKKTTREIARHWIKLSLSRNRSNSRLHSITRAKTWNRSGALEISFGWLFAIIAGVFIIFLAIYISSKLINSEKEAISAETGKEIGILLNPLETGFESSQTTSITIPAETRIHNGCDDFSGNFGRQIIQLDQKNLGKWTKTDVNVFFNNKYIFSEEEIEGKKFYVFSKPFDFPFKVSDLFYMTSSNERYCFMNAPDEINNEILDLNQSNLAAENCSSNDVTVCFDSDKCDINIDYNSGVVEKNGESMYFAGTRENPRALMYAAIFSNKDIYECQVKRLMMRLKEISLLYVDKEILNSNKGCNGNLGSDLTELRDMADSFSSSEEIGAMKEKADIIYEKNDGAFCMLW